MSRCEAILRQIDVSGIASIASTVRQANEQESLQSGLTAPLHTCNVNETPTSGSYNLVYLVEFDDHIRWVLKVPFSGHHGCWDDLSADALESEALTMRLIRAGSSVPVPTVHDFDSSMDNTILVPYILMECMPGRPLHEIWFEEGFSASKQQVVRFRALQTIAKAMAELSKFAYGQSGMLKFDADGEVIGLGGARVPDNHSMYERSGDPANNSRDDMYCTKQSSTSTLGDLLYLLDKRGLRDEDTALDHGRHQTLRLFTKFLTQVPKFDGGSFVLAHPDLDSQNILVQDDGTLCGIIDWDGVAAVPHEVGALKCPLFIARDWDPENYNYDVETRGSRWLNGRQEECPVSQGVYRSIYAQFIEAELSSIWGSDHLGKKVSLITRLSPLIGCLEKAASDPWVTECNMELLFDRFQSVSDELEEEGFSETNDEADALDEGEDEASDEEVDEDGEGTDDIQDEPREVYHEVTHPSNKNSMDPRSSIEESFPIDQGAMPLRATPSHTTIPPSEGAASVAVLPPVNHALQSSAASCKTKVTTYLLGMGENACMRAARLLHRSEGGPHIQQIEPEAHTYPTEVSSSADAVTKLKDVEKSGRRMRLKKLLRLAWTKLRTMLQRVFASGSVARELGPDLEAQLDGGTKVDIKIDRELDTGKVSQSETKKTAKKAICTGKIKEKEDESGNFDPREAWERIALEAKNCGVEGTTIKTLQPKIAGMIIEICKAEQKRLKNEAELNSALRPAEAAGNNRKLRKSNKVAKVSRNLMKDNVSGGYVSPSSGDQQSSGDSEASHATRSDEVGSDSPHRISSRSSLASDVGPQATLTSDQSSLVGSESSHGSIASDDIRDGGVEVAIRSGRASSEASLAEDKESDLSEDEDNAETDHDGTSEEEDLCPVDNGRFTMNEIFVAMGNANIDHERFHRLKAAFQLLVDSLTGKR